MFKRKFQLKSLIFIAGFLSASLSFATSPLERCRFTFFARRSEILLHLKAVQNVIRGNWYITNRGWFLYKSILSDLEATEYDLEQFILRPRPVLRWWDSGGGQGRAIREAAQLLSARGQKAELVINSLKRPLSSYLRWPSEIAYHDGVPSENFSKNSKEQFDLITDVFAPGGFYSVDVVGVMNSYLEALAVGGNLVMLTSFRTQVLVDGKPQSLATWLEQKLKASGDYKVHVTRNKTLWATKLRSSNFRLSDLDIESYRSDEEVYRGYSDPES